MRRLVGSLLTLALLALGLLMAPAASAATFQVTNVNDSGPGSLRQALADAAASPGADTITVTATGTLNLVTPLVYPSNDSVTVVGGGITIDASGIAGANRRALDFTTSTGSVVVSNLTITGGVAVTSIGTSTNPDYPACNAVNPGNGGGIRHGGELTLTNVTLLGNRAQGTDETFTRCPAVGSTPPAPPTAVTANVGGFGGGVFTVGNLTIRDSIIRDNAAEPAAGSTALGEDGQPTGRGGGAYASGVLTVINSLVENNRAAAQGGGLYALTGMRVQHSTVRTNNAGNVGGGIFSAGNGLEMSESTVSGNTAVAQSGGIHAGTTTGRAADIVNSTIVGNQVTAPTSGGGGLFAPTGGSVTIRYSSFSGNSAPATPAHLGGVASTTWKLRGVVLGPTAGGGAACGVAGQAMDAQYNYETGSSTCFGAAGNNTVNGAAPFATGLADNGGSTPTNPNQTLMPGAPIQGFVPVGSADCGYADTDNQIDQRSRIRPFDNRCDAGAVEDINGETPVTPPATPDNPNPQPPPPSGICTEFNPVNPIRVLDTRIGTGGTLGTVGQGQAINVGVTGLAGVGGGAGVPSSGVAAVVLNVTSTQSSQPSFVTVWPAGSARPTASNLNTEPGVDVPNLTIARVGTGGQVSLYNNGGTVHLVADVLGWFASCGNYTALVPNRVLDTRIGTGGVTGKVGQGRSISVPVTGGSTGVPTSGITAVVLNVTSTEATNASFVTVWPTGAPRPLASNLNLEPGQDVPNLVIAKVGANGRVSMFNNAGETHLVADVLGYFNFNSTFVPLNPTRALDTRVPLGATGPLGQGDVRTLQVTGAGGEVPVSGVSAVVVNVTATESTAQSFVTVWPFGANRPTASNLNTEPGVDVPNLTIAQVGNAGSIALYNNAGSVHLVGDILGYFPAPPS